MPTAPNQPDEPSGPEYPPDVLKAPFGSRAREFLIDRYFAGLGTTPTPNDAWLHVYRLLLWIDSTTSLAHCYESDKSQPGRHWYARSLAFHDWLSTRLDVEPLALEGLLDVLFRETVEIDKLVNTPKRVKRMARGEETRIAMPRSMPAPTGDPRVVAQVSESLASYYHTPPSDRLVREVIETVTTAKSIERKRKNLLGEGFEDLLASLMRRCDQRRAVDVHARKYLHQIPGFREPPKKDKARAVDLAVVHRASGRRTLATVKWSVRADREEQFSVDLRTYNRMEHSGDPFDFVFITNEFDAARLVTACERRHEARPMFSDVVHVNPAALVHVHSSSPRGKAIDLLRLIEEGRLTSLGTWLERLFAGDS